MTEHTVKPITRGGGTKVPFTVVLFVPTVKRSDIALIQGNPVVAENGLPGPDLWISAIRNCIISERKGVLTHP